MGLEALLAQFVPAHHVFAPVAGDVFFAGVQRPMWRGVGYVTEKRFVGVIRFVTLMFGDEFDGVVGYRIGVIKILTEVLIDGRVIAGQGCGVDLRVWVLWLPFVEPLEPPF